jgi:hypothetical protein
MEEHGYVQVRQIDAVSISELLVLLEIPVPCLRPSCLCISMSFNKSGISSMRFKHLRKPVLIAGVLIGGASMVAGSAQAALFTSRCNFTAAQTECKGSSGFGWSTLPLPAPGNPPLQLGDKLLNIINYSFGDFDNAGVATSPSGEFVFTYLDQNGAGPDPSDTWNVRTVFDTTVTGDALAGPATGFLNYTLQIVDPGFQFNNVTLDSAHIGVGTSVFKTIAGLSPTPYLTSINGATDSKPLGGTLVNVTDNYSVLAAGGLNAFNNGFTQTPAPLPILGVGAAFGSIRKLRKFSSRLKTFSMG